MRTRVVIVPLLLLLGWDAPRAQETGAHDPEKIWALVVGISNYTHAEPLLFAATDARSYADFLVSPRGGSIPRDHIVTLVEEDATRTRVEVEIEALWDKVQEGDTVYIFIAGHGLYNKRRIAYFIPSDGDPRTPNSTAINLLAFQQMVTQGFSHASRRILITDMCHAGTLAAQQNLINQYMKEAFGQAPGGALLNLLASGPTEPSWENEELGHGIFTYALLEALNGRGLATSDSLLRSDNLVRFVTSEVPKWTANQQNPVVNDNFDPSLPLSFLDQPGPLPFSPETSTILLLANADQSLFVRIQWTDPTTEAVTVQRIPKSSDAVPVGPLAPGPLELVLFDSENRARSLTVNLEKGENRLDIRGAQLGLNRFLPGPLKQVASMAPAAPSGAPGYLQEPVREPPADSSLLLKLNEGTQVYFDDDFYGSSQGEDRPMHIRGLEPGDHTVRLVYSPEHEGRFRVRLFRGSHLLDPDTAELRPLSEVDPPPTFQDPPFELADNRQEELYRRLAESLWEGRLAGLEGNSALDYYRQLEPDLTPGQNETLRKRLIVVMGDRAQRILLKYLRGGDIKWQASTFDEGAHLVTAIQELFQPRDSYLSQYHFFAGRSLLESGRYDEARRELERSVALDPEASQSYNALGLTHWKQGRLEEALRQLDRSIELTPAWNYPRVTRAFIYLEQRLFAEAESEFSQATRMDPDDSTAVHGLGQLHFLLQRWPEARAQVDRAIQLNPGNAYAYETLGLIHQRLFQYREAEEAFRLAARLEPNELSFRISLAELLRQMGQINQGRDIFARLLAERGEEPPILAAYADFLSRSGTPEEAVGLYEKALKAAPEDLDLRLKYGVLLRGQERYTDATRELRRVAGADPSNHFAPYQLAEISFARKQISEAAELAQKSIQNNPRYAPPYRLLGQIEFANHRLEEAREFFRKSEQLAIEAHQRQELQELIRQVEEILVEEQVVAARKSLQSGKYAEAWRTLAETFNKVPDSRTLRDEVLDLLETSPVEADLSLLPRSPLTFPVNTAFWRDQRTAEQRWKSGQKEEAEADFVRTFEALDGSELVHLTATDFNFENENHGIHGLVYRWGARLLEDGKYESVLLLLNTALEKRVFAVIPNLSPVTVDSLMRASDKPEPQGLSEFEIAHHPDRRAHELFAAAFAGEGDLQQSLSYLEALEGRQPDLAARVSVARALSRNRAWEDAISVLKDGLARSAPTSSPDTFIDASIVFSRILCESGDCGTGRAALEAALRIFPDNKDLRQALREIR